MDIVVAVLAVLIGLVVGALGGYLVRQLVTGRRVGAARTEAAQILEDAAEQERKLLIDAKEETLRIRSEVESEARERRGELQRVERRLVNREENLDGRGSNLERREKGLAQKEEAIEGREKELEELKETEIQRLESVSNLSIDEAKELLMRRADEDVQHELARRYRDQELQWREEADDKARNILALAVHRLASDVVSEASVTSVPLPNDDMKGRLIGREGRNIRAIEKATGVDLIIDDTPEAVTLSCFDPIRREVARIAVGKLIADGRIHPARIEEMVAKTEKEVADTVRKVGEQTILDLEVRGLHPEMIKLLGRLKFRYSFGENVLMHSIEVSRLAAMIASEMGANVKVAKVGGLLHDIGKALSHEVEGPHAEIGAAVAARHEVSGPICTSIAEHHNDDMTTIESFIVAAADAISAARPGSRSDTVEHYIKRLEALEEVARAFDGVEKCYAIQAGREVRVLVRPQSVDDVGATKLARDIVRKIEETLAYPGQIKVTVIRESRAVDYAR
jgi:ribonuclease Y